MLLWMLEVIDIKHMWACHYVILPQSQIKVVIDKKLTLLFVCLILFSVCRMTWVGFVGYG